MDLSPQDLDAWRRFLDEAPPRMRTIVHLLMQRIADLRHRVDAQRATLESERRHLAELEHLVDAIGGARTREV